MDIFHNRNLDKLFTRKNIKKGKKIGMIDPTMRYIAATLFRNKEALDYGKFAQ